MFEAQSINAEHKDLIHDVAYDFYGQRMATCSSDQFVKVKKGSHSMLPLHAITSSLSWETCLKHNIDARSFLRVLSLNCSLGFRHTFLMTVIKICCYFLM